MSAQNEEKDFRCQTVPPSDQVSRAGSELDISQLYPTLRILNVGCGNSELPEQMYDAGFRHITNVDISRTVINMMEERNLTKRPTLLWRCMDCTDLSAFDNQTFDIVIEKATMDSLLCGNRAYERTAQMLGECQRLLKTDGYLMSVTFATPEARELHFKRPHLKLHPIKIIPFQSNAERAPATNYIFICKKQQGADKIAAIHWKSTLEQVRKQEAEKGYFDESSGDEEDEEAKI